MSAEVLDTSSRARATRVLVVEDDPLVGQALVTTLESLGFEVLPRAENIVDAVVTAQRGHPDLAILDINLADDGDGVDLARGLRQRLGDLAMIFVTGCADHKTIERAVDVLPSAYLIKPVSPEMVYAAITNALCAKAAARSAAAPAPGRWISHGPRFRKVLAFIEKNLNQSLSLESLAAEAGMSSSQFGRMFKDNLDVTPHQYLIQRRMASACRLLTEGDAPIIEIALSLGYCSQAYFTTVFKKELGCTPATYRRRRTS